ncbi:NUDIX domain-containing protein [Corynebacterium aquatimens]|uniref:ADP-ribose pyrophosphatase n=1 Tax=Corynebacterium aquatimens TaxID=1190508 RepID=A0A931DWI3_9CORY|nr:NUDIX hydrolase [Corynebacterium aquatimens]MBG6121547.1 ADP-ribose pyrophosphatase [Corynebacterium aquatimens]WJY65912.1 ADP-ribose pyrophosphatase [Corynebacterium aquatimens]
MSETPRHRFETLDSQLLIDAPILAVRRDTVTMPGGGTAKREIVEHFGAVAVVAVNADNEIAMVEQYRHTVGRRLWELPAGLLDIDGESELIAAQRELVEEAGVTASNWHVLVDLITSPGFAEEAVRVFYATDLTIVDKPEGEEEEADMELAWVSLDQARAMTLRGEIINSIAISGILAACEVVDKRAEPRPVTDPFDLRPTAMASRRRAEGFTPDMKKRTT